MVVYLSKIEHGIDGPPFDYNNNRRWPAAYLMTESLKQ